MHTVGYRRAGLPHRGALAGYARRVRFTGLRLPRSEPSKTGKAHRPPEPCAQVRVLPRAPRIAPGQSLAIAINVGRASYAEWRAPPPKQDAAQ
jgi:hypothetical protein